MNNQAAEELLQIMQDAENLAESQNGDMLSDPEKDALGEIGNICMGTSATTLSTLIGRKVNITTPRVSICHSVQDFGYYQKPFIAVEVSYKSGVDGYNILLMKEEDVMVITDLLMGGSGDIDKTAEIDELHFSAISEVMNQMVGSASTSLADIVKTPVNITPPNVKRITMEDDNIGQLMCHHDTTIKISFAMEIEGILESELMQVIPIQFGRQLAKGLIDEVMNTPEAAASAPGTETPAPEAAAKAAPADAPAPPAAPQATAQPAPPRQADTPPVAGEKSRIGVKAVQYQSFDGPPAQFEMPFEAEFKENINLIMDVPLHVTVELGRCKKSIKEILGFNMGSVIVLDRMAGEMVDILVNGKLFARGEVVVIDDSYGVRVTDIIAMPQT